MVRRISILLVASLLFAAPAMAAPCKTAGSVAAAIPFPKGDASDVPFARSMIPVMLPEISAAVPRLPTCTRSTLRTALGDFVLSGENGDAFPRVAVPSNGKADPIVYLAPSPGAGDTLALVVLRRGSSAVVTRFYAGVPSDARLAADIPAAVTDEQGIMRFEFGPRTVLYSFAPDRGPPPAVEPSKRPGVDIAGTGPQIFIPDSGDPSTLDPANGLRHRPSGFACPQTFPGLAVMLMSIDPRGDALACSYRAGTGLALKEGDPMRYQLVLKRQSGSDSVRSVFDQLVASGRASLRIEAGHPPPLATGPGALPEFAMFWETEDMGVQGVWVGKAGAWLVWLRAQYPPTAADDAEAGKVARILFAAVAREVGAR